MSTVRTTTRKKTNSFRSNGKTLRTPKGGLRKKPSQASSVTARRRLTDKILPSRTIQKITENYPLGNTSSSGGQNVLMFGWELPPFNSGGLGVASYELAHALAEKGVNITFVLPYRMDVKAPFMKLVFASDKQIDPDYWQKRYGAYHTASVSSTRSQDPLQDIEDTGMLGEVLRYAAAARRIARSTSYDLIHAHDWLCIPAGFAAKRIKNKPLIFHVHATEFDRSGGASVDSRVFAIEKAGIERSDRVIAVSEYTKRTLITRYGAASDRIDVVHNGVSAVYGDQTEKTLQLLKSSGKKVVLFVGRLTLQKGPDWFLRAARIVADHDRNVMFVIAGTGDMLGQVVEEAASLNLSDRVLFAGFARGRELALIYRSADVYVMPSVSEPFGITALEALTFGTPVIVSKQSGVSEVLRHALRVDFWDTYEMANKILGILHYRALPACMAVNGLAEADAHNWGKVADDCLRVYEKLER